MLAVDNRIGFSSLSPLQVKVQCCVDVVQSQPSRWHKRAIPGTIVPPYPLGI